VPNSRTHGAVVLVSGKIGEPMRYKMGRLLQFVGLFVILPLAIAGQVVETLTLGQMFLWTAVGVIVFYAGRSLQESVQK
jgi:hypothetical protein